MSITDEYSKAFTEVYEILSYLNKEEYEKIPKDLINVIAKYRNKEYEYYIDSSEDLASQEMLTETKAILFNIFRDYLSTPEQKQKIKNWQMKEMEKIEEDKKQNFEEKELFESKRNTNENLNKNKVEENLPVEVKKNSIFTRVMEFIKGKILKSS